MSLSRSGTHRCIYRLHKRSDVIGGTGDSQNLIEHSPYAYSNQPINRLIPCPTLQIKPMVSTVLEIAQSTLQNSSCCCLHIKTNKCRPVSRKLTEDETRVQPVSEGLGAFC